MTIVSRTIGAASILVLGLALGLQPLSMPFSATGLGSTSAHAKSDNGGGGGNGGGEGRGSDKGERGGGLADRGGNKGEGKNRSVEIRGGAAAQDSAPGRGANISILEGFLSDLRGEKKSGPSSASHARSGEKPKSAGVEKNGKGREAKIQTTITQSPTVTTPTTSTKVSASSLGRLNAAHASPRALERASANSTIGLMREYKEALLGKTADGASANIDRAATALAALANKDVTVDVVRTLNEMLGIENISEDQVKELVDKVDAIKNDEEENG